MLFFLFRISLYVTGIYTFVVKHCELLSRHHMILFRLLRGERRLAKWKMAVIDTSKCYQTQKTAV